MKPTRATPPAVALSLGIVGLISLACVAMLVWLQPGLPTEPLVEQRMAYIAGHPLQWKLGWALWMGSALGFLLFCHWLAQYTPEGITRRYAVTLVAIGIAPDLAAELLFSTVQPWLIQHPGLDGTAFELVEFVAMQLTGSLANGAYNLGGLTLNLLLLRNPRIPPLLALAGLPAWLAGIGLSIATAAQAIDAALWSTAIAMVWSVAWMALVTLVLFTQPQRYRWPAAQAGFAVSR